MSPPPTRGPGGGEAPGAPALRGVLLRSHPVGRRHRRRLRLRLLRRSRSEEQVAAAERARDGVERRLAQMGFEARGRATVPDGNYGVAWALLVAAPPVLTEGLLYHLGEVAGDAWRQHYKREPWLA